MPAKRALASLVLTGERVHMIAQETLSCRDIDLPLVLTHQLFPTHVPRTLPRGLVSDWKIGFFSCQLGIDRYIRSHEISVSRAFESHILQAQLETRDFVILPIGYQPVVGVPAVVSLPHDASEVIDRSRILKRFPRPHKLRYPLGLPAAEIADGRLRHHNPRRVDAEIVGAVNQAR